ncbi:Sigma factor RpoE regulatory protein RseC [hydrothermal vent metagenome]|uniref:Sigma factor RpoE regulatory protein RseC n=1 Tax=hydrothermal vent metagenome TaxID=652676 RepID=A0A3B0YDD6_9ZZZZ
MLEETAQVKCIAADEIWVETQRRSACSSCSANKGCGSATLAKVLGKRRTLVRVLSDLPLAVGDRVVIGIREQALVRGSLAVYAVPLMLLLAGAVLGELGAAQGLWASAEAASVLLGLSGLMAGLLWLRIFTQRIRHDTNYQPVVLRRIATATMNHITVS